MTHPTIERARIELLEREQPARAELLSQLAKLPSEHVPELLSLADDVRSRYCGNGIAVEVLYNAKRGGCSEDCNFCSQSARYATDVEPERLSSVEEFVEAAGAAHARGAGEFCIVVAVRGPSERLLARVCEAVVRIKSELPLTVAVSLGILTEAHIERLAEAGRRQGQSQPRELAPVLSASLHDAHLRRALGDVLARQATGFGALLRRDHRDG